MQLLPRPPLGMVKQGLLSSRYICAQKTLATDYARAQGRHRTRPKAYTVLLTASGIGPMCLV